MSDSADQRPDRQVLKTVAVVAFLVVALLFYFVRLGGLAIAYIADGGFAGIAIGIGMLLLPVVGIWILWATLSAAFAHQRLARRIHEEGLEVDTSSCRADPRAGSNATRPTPCSRRSRPNGKPTRTTGAPPTDWPAPTTTPATAAARRDTMRRAVALEKLERDPGE